MAQAPKWSEAEIVLLWRLWPDKEWTLDRLATRIGRSKDAVSAQARALKIGKRPLEISRQGASQAFWNRSKGRNKPLAVVAAAPPDLPMPPVVFARRCLCCGKQFSVSHRYLRMCNRCRKGAGEVFA